MIWLDADGLAKKLAVKIGIGVKKFTRLIESLVRCLAAEFAAGNMVCRFPHVGYKRADGGFTFSRNQSPQCIPLKVPCGKCQDCRNAKISDWLVRAQHTSAYESSGIFITLTYADESLPRDGRVSRRDIQCFLKRLRKFKCEHWDTVSDCGHQYSSRHSAGISYLIASEYGDKGNRPHYHGALWGLTLHDSYAIRGGTSPLYTSPLLAKIWGKGYISFGSLNSKSLRYSIAYSLKNIGIDDSFLLSSRRPALGRLYFDEHYAQMAKRGYCRLGRAYARIPDYYMRLYADAFPALSEGIRSLRQSNIPDELDYYTACRQYLARVVAETVPEVRDLVDVPFPPSVASKL